MNYDLLNLFVRLANDINSARAVKDFNNLDVLKNTLEDKLSDDKPKYGIRLNNVNHIGFNMRYNYDTPFGIYFYPLTSTVYNQLVLGTLPFLTTFPFIHLIKLSGNILYTDSYNSFDEDLNKLKSFYPDISVAREKFKGSDFQKLIEAFHIYGKHTGEEQAFYTYKLYRKLGYDSVIDYSGIVHENEKEQGFIMSNNYEVVKALINPLRTEEGKKNYINVTPERSNTDIPSTYKSKKNLNRYINKKIDELNSLNLSDPELCSNLAII
jgi:hypothetical protein